MDDAGAGGDAVSSFGRLDWTGARLPYGWGNVILPPIIIGAHGRESTVKE